MPDMRGGQIIAANGWGIEEPSSTSRVFYRGLPCCKLRERGLHRYITSKPWQFKLSWDFASMTARDGSQFFSVLLPLKVTIRNSTQLNTECLQVVQQTSMAYRI